MARLMYLKVQQLRDEDGQKILIEDDQINALLKELHDEGGHLGLNLLYKDLRRRFMFPHMYYRTNKYINNCLVCKMVKGKKQKATGGYPPYELSETLGIDLLEIAIPNKKHTLLLVCVDYSSMWPFIYMINNGSAKEVI